MTAFLIIMLGAGLLVLIGAPLVVRGLADPLPDLRDPVTVDLEEERDALLRAIHELEQRDDLGTERREELRRRYEAKAARVLRQLDERAGTAAARPKARPQAGARVPWAGVTLAVLFIGTVVALGGWILPRTGQATVTSFFQADLDSARQLRRLQRAAEREPTAENLLALGDFHWEAGDVEAVISTYSRVLDTLSPPPAEAAKRLGLLRMSEDPAGALELLELADSVAPGDPETVFYLAEMQLVFGDFEASRESWRAFLELDDQAGGAAQASARLELLDTIIPLYAQIAGEGESRDLLVGVGDAWWQAGEQELAVDSYFRVLTEFDPFDARALSRVGQMLFTSGRTEEGVLLLERAVAEGGVDAEALLFLGNGHYTLENWESAITAWDAYVDMVGPDGAGRVPGLIEDAEARLAGREPSGSPALPGAPDDAAAAPQASAAGPQDVTEAPGTLQLSAESLFTANCATCHGSQARGGTGPALAGNPRVADRAMVENTIRFGRGAMPGFMATLSGDAIAALSDYVSTELATQ